jgi:hypothetical protein
VDDFDGKWETAEEGATYADCGSSGETRTGRTGADVRGIAVTVADVERSFGTAN